MSEKLRFGTIAETAEEVEQQSFSEAVDPVVRQEEPITVTPDSVPVADTASPTDEVFPGGPTKMQIDAWKQEYGEVYVTTIGLDQNYIWRLLNRFEYRRLIKTLEQAISAGQMSEAEANLNNEELIAEMVLLYPKLNKAQLAGTMAGISSVIAQQAMEASGFIATDVRQL